MSTFIICGTTYILWNAAPRAARSPIRFAEDRCEKGARSPAIALTAHSARGHRQHRGPVMAADGGNRKGKIVTDLTEETARAVIAPWYSLFNVASRGDVKTIQERILTEDYESCAGYLPGECWGRDTSIKVVSNFANTIPDMKFDIKEMLVAGDRVIVRGEVTGTPAGELFGVPHSGKSFRIMAVDIQTIRDGKIAKTCHMENWLSAIGQLRAK